ncbi:hypothetical protein BEP19_15850 [Ammoniphilus oxalaticus]|uniref:YqbQ/XkdQ domain-containing protein n=1 Tax=Ammoniphilus oxalaticus TaxID=66863 RepID=A0A419SQA7_9BACL|nr:hypothetical protein [Ammoniphilus oxalaticus]RKD26680.1 hypothetical protein BEP19_15850 [Ammoniphilus oxalaticus]
MAHKLWLVKPDKMIDITPLIGTLSWRGNVNELGEEISFDVAFNDARYFPKNPCDLGDVVILEGKDGVEITRAVIINETRNGRNPISYNAFDYAFYLNKSKKFYQFEKMQADQAIRKIVSDAGVPIGSIVSIPIPITKIYERDERSSTIKDILEIATKSNGIKYRHEMRQGKFYLEPQGQTIVNPKFKFVWGEIDATLAISEPSRTRSIEDMKNSIEVVVDGKVVAQVKDDNLIKRFGLLQEVNQVSSDEEKKKPKQIAQNLLKDLGKVFETASIILPGDDSVRAGRLIELDEPVTGLKGQYLIDDVTHTITSGIHTMQLSLEVR